MSFINDNKDSNLLTTFPTKAQTGTKLQQALSSQKTTVWACENSLTVYITTALQN